MNSAATGLCYRHFPQQVNWTEARRSCNESGDGDLASVPDLGTNYFLTSLITNSSREAAWIGAFRDENDTIHWSDGSPTTYQSHIMVQRALIYFVQQRNMTKYIGSCIVANPLNLKACV